MNDLPERAAAARTSLMGVIRLAPPAELAGVSRRRRRRRAGAVAGAVVAAIGLIPLIPRSSPPPPPTTAQPYLLDHTITADGGRMVLSPPDPAAKPEIPSDRAAEVLPRLVLAGLGTPEELYLADVASPLDDPYRSGTPTRRFAWVLTTGPNATAVSCPFAPTATPATTSLYALIVDAYTGEAMVYASPACPSGQSSLKRANTAYSVPFEVRADGTVLPQLPPCGEPFAFERSGTAASTEVRILAFVPVAPCPYPTPSPVPFAGPEVRPSVKHAPVGPITDDHGRLVVTPR